MQTRPAFTSATVIESTRQDIPSGRPRRARSGDKVKRYPYDNHSASLEAERRRNVSSRFLLSRERSGARERSEQRGGRQAGTRAKALELGTHIQHAGSCEPERPTIRRAAERYMRMRRHTRTLHCEIQADGGRTSHRIVGDGRETQRRRRRQAAMR